MSKNAVTVGEKATKACPQGGLARRKLADISNMPQKPQLLIQEEKLQSFLPTTSKECIDQLQKENMALVKLLAQRNKLVEQSGFELDRLRVNLLKMQEQNRQLAQQNSQILADLNSGKDRLKALQHELGCKNGLLKARQLDIEDKAPKKTCKKHDIKDENETQITQRTLQPNCLGSPEQVQSKEDAETIRPFKRRQSARFKADKLRPTEDLCTMDVTKSPACPFKRPFKRRQSARPKATELKAAEGLCNMDDTKSLACPLSNNSVPGKESTSANSSVKIEEKEFSSDLSHESQSSGRSSLCRPSRVAAKKVQSYKEVPLNVKMRRSQ